MFRWRPQGFREVIFQGLFCLGRQRTLFYSDELGLACHGEAKPCIRSRQIITTASLACERCVIATGHAVWGSLTKERLQEAFLVRRSPVRAARMHLLRQGSL